jgi:hypothetical protein
MDNEPIKGAPDRMTDDKKLPADSEMEKAVERAKAADGIKEESARQAEQQSDRR